MATRGHHDEVTDCVRGRLRRRFPCLRASCEGFSVRSRLATWPMADAEVSQALRITLDRQRADDWALALASAGIEIAPRSERRAATPSSSAKPTGRAPTPSSPRSKPRTAPPRAAAVPHRRADVAYGAFVVAVLLCAFFVVTGPRGERGVLVRARRRGRVAHRQRRGVAHDHRADTARRFPAHPEQRRDAGALRHQLVRPDRSRAAPSG